MTSRHRHSLRRLLATLGAAIVSLGSILAVTGCGGSSTIDPVATAAMQSTSSPGYRMNLALQLSSSALPTALTGTGSGSFDARHHSGSFSLDMNFGQNPQVTQALGSSTLHLVELINGLTLYMKLPPALMSRMPTSAKPWLKLDLGKAAASAGIPGLSSLVNNPASSDPSQLLQYLRAVSGNVTNKGSEQVGGVQTTHYSVQVDLDRVPNLVPAASRKAAEQGVKALEAATNVHQLPVDVWVDRGHLVRRMRMSFQFATGGQSVNMAMTIDIPQYGPQPRPTLPPADQVTDLTSLIGSH